MPVSRDEVDVETCFAKDMEWIQGFGYEEALVKGCQFNPTVHCMQVMLDVFLNTCFLSTGIEWSMRRDDRDQSLSRRGHGVDSCLNSGSYVFQVVFIYISKKIIVLTNS